MGSWNFFPGKKVQNIKSESKSSGQLGEFFMVWIFPFFYAQVSQGISSYYQSHMILPSPHWLFWLWINTFFHRGLIWIWIKVQKSETAIVLSLIFSLIFKSLSVLRVWNSISEQTIKSNSSGQLGQVILHGFNFVIFLLFCQPSTT